LAAGIGVRAAEPPPEDLEGLPIVDIVIVRRDIFDTADPKTSTWFHRAANAVHIVSREKMIRQMILFSEGEPYSSRSAAESARLLRSLGFMDPVDITARRVEGGVEVTVETHDKWTLEASASFGLTGSRQEYGVEFQEENFLGWGKKIDLGYTSDVERDTIRYRYRDPNVFGSRWRLDVLHENLSDGSRGRIETGRPFYSLSTPRAWLALWDDLDLVRHLYSETGSVVNGRQASQIWAAHYGIRLRSRENLTRRLSFGWLYHRVEYSDWRWLDDGSPYPTPESRQISGPTVSFEQIPDRFEVLKGYRMWSAQEDVGFGPRYRVGLTVSLPELGGDTARLLLDGRYSSTWRAGGWIVTGDGWLQGRFDDGDPHNWLAGLQATLSKLGTRGWQFRLLAEGSHELDLDRQLTLGADIGLRGWDPDFFDGTGRALANVQWRTLLKEDVFHLFSLGVVLFADAGATWDARVGHDTDGLRSDAGAGLLFDLTRFGSAKLLRVEAAWPDDNSGITVVVIGEALF